MDDTKLETILVAIGKAVQALLPSHDEYLADAIAAIEEDMDDTGDAS